MTRRHQGLFRSSQRSNLPWQGLALGVMVMSMASCTDSPGAAPRGASAVQPSSGGCGIGPYVIPVGGTITTGTTLGDRAEDGAAGADVACTVRHTSSGYSIRGELKQGSSSFFLTGTVTANTDGSHSGTGSVNFYDPNSLAVSSSTCTILIGAPPQVIDDGKVWGQVSCTDSRQGTSPGFSCNFSAYFVLENCSS